MPKFEEIPAAAASKTQTTTLNAIKKVQRVHRGVQANLKNKPKRRTVAIQTNLLSKSEKRQKAETGGQSVKSMLY